MLDLRAIEAKLGASGRDRTCDLMIKNHLLFQLSYARVLVGLAGIEPATKRL